ncbi:hypothetical protein OGATHE_004206, partial [Ogataea polymorpha]
GADKQMKKAEKYQKATTKCKIVFFLVLMILLLLMLLLVKPKRVDHYYESKPKQPATDPEPTPQPTAAPQTESLDDYESLIAESG